MDDPNEWEEVAPIGGMKTWACSYIKDGKRFAITLLGTDPNQVLIDNCDALEDFSVDGEVLAILSPKSRDQE